MRGRFQFRLPLGLVRSYAPGCWDIQGIHGFLATSVASMAPSSLIMALTSFRTRQHMASTGLGTSTRLALRRQTCGAKLGTAPIGSSLISGRSILSPPDAIE